MQKASAVVLAVLAFVVLSIVGVAIETAGMALALNTVGDFHLSLNNLIGLAIVSTLVHQATRVSIRNNA